MTPARFAAKLNPQRRKNKKGEYSILIRVTLGPQVRYINTKIKIKEKYWKERDNLWVTDNHPAAFEINSLVRNNLHMLQKWVYRQELFNKPVTMHGILEFYKKKGDPNSFIDLAENYVNTNKDLRSRYNTWKKYRTFLALIKEFDPGIIIGQMDEQLFSRYIEWRRKKFNVSDETISKDFDCWRIIAKEAIKEGYLDRNPFEYVQLRLKKSNKKKNGYLDIDELKQLKHTDLSQRPDLQDIRDSFFFCVYTCMYYSNLRVLRWIDIIEGPKGYCIESIRTKNEQPFMAPIYIFPHAIEILEKQRRKDPEFVFPDLISEQKYNKKLKDLATVAGIDKKISNKFARKTGATFLSSLGLETHFLKKIMGHTKESTTHEYLYTASKEVTNRMDKLNVSELNF